MPTQQLPQEIAKTVSPVSRESLWKFLEISSVKTASAADTEQRILMTLSALLAHTSVRQ